MRLPALQLQQELRPLEIRVDLFALSRPWVHSLRSTHDPSSRRKFRFRRGIRWGGIRDRHQGLRINHDRIRDAVTPSLAGWRKRDTRRRW